MQQPPMVSEVLRALISCSQSMTLEAKGTVSCQPWTCMSVHVFINFSFNERHSCLARRISECQFHAKARSNINLCCQSISLMHLFMLDCLSWLSTSQLCPPTAQRNKQSAENYKDGVEKLWQVPSFYPSFVWRSVTHLVVKVSSCFCL